MRSSNGEGDGQDVKTLAALAAGVGANVSEYAFAIAAARAAGGTSASILLKALEAGDASEDARACSPAPNAPCELKSNTRCVG